MPAIPEFLLRKLYVPDSLKPVEGGYVFELNNSFAPINLTGFTLTVDETLWDIGRIYLSLPGSSEIPAGGISGEHPFNLAVNATVQVRVKGQPPQKRLVIRADTREAGPLQFAIPFQMEAEVASKKPNWLKRTRRRFQYAGMVFRVQQNPQHPSYHFAPPANWMNDPNGLIYWKGNYHLFYQYNPVEACWGNIHWGHAVSKDLLHWKHLPIALAPDPNGPDAGGCFSGCAVDQNGTATLVYTGVYPESQCAATCETDDLLVWNRLEKPIIPSPPAGLALEGFRDPCVWREAGEWRMVLGSGLTGAGGAILLYRSKNLLDWKYMGILYQREAKNQDPFTTGTMWECPSFFPLGDKWVLIVSACAAEGPLYTIYFTGQYSVDRFIPDGPPRLLDGGAGGCLYAPQTFLDRKGERVLIGWLREARSVAEQKTAGWSGAMSLPRLLSLSAKGEVCSVPIETIQTLRGEEFLFTKHAKPSDVLRGGCFEILLGIPPDVETWSGLHLASVDKEEKGILIGYDCTNGVVVVDCRKAGGYISAMPVTAPALKELTLHIFVDGSILEVYAEDQHPLSARFYLEKPNTLKLRLIGDASAELFKLRV